MKIRYILALLFLVLCAISTQAIGAAGGWETLYYGSQGWDCGGAAKDCYHIEAG